MVVQQEVDRWDEVDSMAADVGRKSMDAWEEASRLWSVEQLLTAEIRNQSSSGLGWHRRRWVTAKIERMGRDR